MVYLLGLEQKINPDPYATSNDRKLVILMEFFQDTFQFFRKIEQPGITIFGVVSELPNTPYLCLIFGPRYSLQRLPEK